MNYDESLEKKTEFDENDQKLLEALAEQKERVAKHIQSHRLHLAAEEAYHYFWHTFADKIIEEKKAQLQSEDKEEKARVQSLLLKMLKEQLIMLHPFMPFISEAVYQQLPLEDKKEFLMVEEW